MNIRSLFIGALTAAALWCCNAAPAAAQGCGSFNPNCVVPTAPTSDNSSRAASTAFVKNYLSAVPQTIAKVSHQWLDSYTASTGAFTQSQPSFLDLAGTASATQLPAVPTVIGSSTGNTLTGPSEIFICTSTCTVTPPVPVAGYEFCVMNDDNVSTVITLGAIGSSVRYEATARTSYGTAGSGTLTSGGAAGDMICLHARDATHYLSPTYVGTWTAS